MNGVYDNYLDLVNHGRQGLMVNEFLIYWPLVSGYLLPKENKHHFKDCMKGSAQKTLKALMSLLEIEGYDNGGHLPLSNTAISMFKHFR